VRVTERRMSRCAAQGTAPNEGTGAIREPCAVPCRGMVRQRRKSRTLMRPPVVKGQRYPLSGFLAFFRLVDASIVGHRQRVLTWFPMQSPQRGRTTHCVRFARHGYDKCSNPSVGLLRPSNLAAPSSRPRQKPGETLHAFQGGCRLG